MHGTLPNRKPRSKNFLLHIGDVIFIWWQRGRQRYRLSALDCWTLDDIGVSPAEARTEAQKPFWKK